MLNRYEAYELPVEGDNEVQGMIALKHIRNQYYIHSGRRNNMIIAERKNVGDGAVAIPFKESDIRISLSLNGIATAPSPTFFLSAIIILFRLPE